MRVTFFTFAIVLAYVLINASAEAAYVSLEETTSASSGVLTVEVVLDPEGDSVNAFSGELSVSNEAFEVVSAHASDSVVPLWVVIPKVSEEKDFNARTRIVFEGVIPGGFNGVRSPYYEGVRPGKLFTVELRPKQEGLSRIFLENLEVRRNDGAGTRIAAKSGELEVSVPDISTLPRIARIKTPKEIPGDDIKIFLSRDPSVAGGNWMLSLQEDSSGGYAETIYIAESAISDPHDVKPYTWKRMTTPYVLSRQARNVFIHIKAEYADGSYAYATVPPVENSSATPYAGIILLGIGLLAFLYRHVHQLSFSKK